MLIEAFRIEGRRGQVLTIPRSCASVHCEPCQGLTAAALSRSYVVPRGSFGGDNYPCTALMRTVEIRCTALKIHSSVYPKSFLFSQTISDNPLKYKIKYKSCIKIFLLKASDIFQNELTFSFKENKLNATFL